MNYQELKNQQPEMWECFFAFSNEQFREGVERMGLQGKQIYSGIGGLYGSKEGIDKFIGFYDKVSEQISKECTPQEVYNDEFCNHECGYVGNDAEAIAIVVDYFGAEKAKAVIRRFAYTKIA